MNQRLLVAVLLIAPLSLFSSISFGAESLASIYQKALERDPEIAAAKFAMEAGQEQSSQGLSPLLPQLNLSGNIGRSHTKTEPDSSDPVLGKNRSIDSDSQSIGIILSQNLFNASNFKGYKQSKSASKQTSIEYKIAEQSLILRVAKSYFDVLSAQENLSVAQSQTRAFLESLERAKLTFKVGTATKTDKLEAQARYDLARADEISASNQLSIAKQALASIIGESPDNLLALNKQATLSMITPEDMQYWVDLAMKNNFQLELSQSGLEISSQEVSKLKSDRLPTLDFVASASKGKQYDFRSDSDADTTNYKVAIELKMPLYTGGLMSSRIREAEHLRSQQQQNQITSQRQVILQTQQAFLTAMNGKQQTDALKQALVSSESALQATRKGVEVGVRTNLDLLDAQQQFFATERDYSFAKYNYLLSVLDLKAAAGILSDKDVEQLNNLLSAAGNS